MRPALRANCGSRGKIQVRCLQGRNASWLSQRHRVVPLIFATIPLAIASWRNSETDQRANGRPRRDGNSQASALIATMILGGKADWTPASWKFVEAGKALIVKTPAPLANNLTRCVEMFRDAGVPETLTRQQYDLRADNVPIRRRVFPGSSKQFRALAFGQVDHVWASHWHDASSWRGRLCHDSPSRSQNASPYL